MMTGDLIGMAMEVDHRELEKEGVEDGDEKSPQCLDANEPKSASAVAGLSRKERRKASKKEKRKQKRKEAAEKALEEEKARLNDPEEQRRIQLEEVREKERLERERREFEEKERLFLEALARRKALEEEEEEERRRSEDAAGKLNDNEVAREDGANEDDEWEYIEEGPPQIIWQGNEIIVKKNKVRVKKKDVDEHVYIGKEDPDRPTSNPLLPQSEAFADLKNRSMISAQELLENVAQQVPNFGTEQDKAHCPFHLKTGACRFGTRCSRVHFYPDKSCTLLIKNMYNGPGLAWEQDEGLEYTDEEIDHSYEEFYEDVHTEFLKFGEIVNFKVCRNGSNHLRGNVYVHYVSLDAAVLACHAINGRYFAGKQVSCEFVNVTKWRVAICGEFMKSKLKTCSRGTACNFIHCFRNPGGDYEWADWDKPAPKYWAKKMAALFGYSNESGYEKWSDEESPRHHGNSSKSLTTSSERYHSRRSQSTDIKSSNKSLRDHYKKDESQSNKYRRRHIIDDATRPEFFDERQYEEKGYSISWRHDKNRQRQYDSESERECLDAYQDADEFHDQTRKTSRHRHQGRWESFEGGKTRRSRSHDYLSDSDLSGSGIEREKHHEYSKKKSKKDKVLSGFGDNNDCGTKERYCSTDASREQSHDSRNALSSKDHLHRKRRKYSSDSGGDSFDGIRERSHSQRKKSQTHRNEVSGLFHWDTGKSLNKKHNLRESEHAKSNMQTGQTRSTLDKGQHSPRKNAKLHHPDAESIDERGRWEPDNVDERETHKRRRKSHGNSRSEHSKESRSSKHKRKTSSRQRDSDEEYKESGENVDKFG